MRSHQIPRSGSYSLVNARVPAALSLQLRPYALDNANGIGALDFSIVNGKFALFDPALPIVDLAGSMVLPCFVDMHVHLDKAYTVERTGVPTGGLGDAVSLSIADGVNRTTEDLERRMDFALRSAYANGTSAMRSHIDTMDAPWDNPAWSVFEVMRENWRGRIALQGSALMAMSRVDGADFDARCADLAARGAVLGMFIAAEPPEKTLDALLDAAQRHGLDLDFHVDENLELASDGLSAIARAKLRSSFVGRITVGHCCSMALRSEAEAQGIIALVQRAGLEIVSLPLSNMFLMDRAPGRTPRQRGITLVREFESAGIPVSFGADNVCDPFFAYGDFDMLEVLRAAVRTAHLDADIARWIVAVSSRPAQAIRFDGGVLAPGSAADFIIFRAYTWTQLLSRPHTDRQVVRNGQEIRDEAPGFEELMLAEGAL